MKRKEGYKCQKIFMKQQLRSFEEDSREQIEVHGENARRKKKVPKTCCTADN